MKTPVEQFSPELSTLTLHVVEGVEPKFKSGDDSSSIHHELPPPASSEEIPDGGYGWVVVSACSLITAFYVGGFNSWGVFQAGLANNNVAQDFTLAFVGSLAVSWVAFGAVPNSWVVHQLGPQRAAILGCFLLGLGLILSSFSAQSVNGLFFTYGIVVGMGNSLCFLACGTLPSQWFKRKRGLANGLVFAGGGLGGCVQSIVLQILIDRFDVAWTFRILGIATLLVTVPAAVLLRERHTYVTAKIDWSFFKDPKFVLLFIGSGIAVFPLLVPPFFVPMYASSLNISSSLASILLGVFNIASGVGRAGLGHFCDVVGPLTSLCVAIVLSAISALVIWPLSNSLAPFIVFILINGLGNGGFFATVPTVVAHIYDSKLRVAFALVVSSWFVGYLMGPPIAGWILELHGGSDAGRAAYHPVMYYTGVMSVGGGLFILAARQLFSGRFFAFA